MKQSTQEIKSYWFVAYVSVAISRNSDYIIGSGNIELDTSIFSIRKAQKIISKTYCNNKRVIITNFIKLTKEEFEDEQENN